MSFVNPLGPHETITSIDQGVDLAASPGTPGVDPVPGTSRLAGVIPNWFQGQPYYWFQVLSGPFKGKFWYVAEQFRSGLRVGQTVTQGQKVGVYAPSGTATEWGWATASGETLARATTGYHENRNANAPPAGKDFAARVRGAKAGAVVPGAPGGNTPTVSGWKVVASQESDGGSGSCGPIGSGGLWYSELSTVPMGTGSDFHALGGLPCMTPLRITNPANGKSVVARKRDVGAGSSFLPVMGIYPATAAALGLSGGKYTVIISRTDGGPLHPVRGTQTTVAGSASGAGAASGASGSTGSNSGSGTQALADYVALRDEPRTNPQQGATLAQSFGWYFSQFQTAASKVFGGPGASP